MRFFLFASLTLVLAACGTSEMPADSGSDASHEAGVGDAGHDAGTLDSGPTDSGGPMDAPMDAGPVDADFDLAVTDTGVDLPVDPPIDLGGDACGFVTTLDTTCGTDTDCAFGIHQTDCCGNTHAIGFDSSESATFDARESACDATYPRCGCPVHPTTTDSGETVSDPTAIQVACVSRGPRNVCLTYISTRPPDGV